MKHLAVCLILAAAIPASGQVRVTQGQDKIDVEINGQPFTTLYYGGDLSSKPYLHPLRSASGTVVTRGFPMENIPGEEQDHPHHTGVWFTHDEVNGLRFWSAVPNQSNPLNGRIVVSKVNELQSGPSTGSISATFHWLKPDGSVLLVEDRVMTFHADPKLRIVDFDITLTAQDEAVKFGDTKEGSFGIRIATSMDEAHGGKMTNAQGKSGEKEVWGKPSEWVDYAGKVGGETLGITIMDHPANPKHPTYWHSRAYGLFAANIFGEHDFFADKTRDGSVTIQPGNNLRFRYRVVVHPGGTASLPIAEMYKEYSAGR